MPANGSLEVRPRQPCPGARGRLKCLPRKRSTGFARVPHASAGSWGAGWWGLRERDSLAMVLCTLRHVLRGREARQEA